MSDRWSWDLPPHRDSRRHGPTQHGISWWRLVLWSAALGALAGVALWAVLPRSYAAEAQAFVSLAPEAAAASDPYAGSPFVLQRMESYAALATSPTVLQAVTQDLGTGNSAQQLAAEVTSSTPPQSVLLNVTVHDESSVRAVALAQSVITHQARAIEAFEGERDVTRGPVKVTVVKNAALVPKLARSITLVRDVLVGITLAVVLAVGAALLVRNSRRPARGSPAAAETELTW